MKRLPKLGLLFAVALLATAAVAVGAQAETFNPDNTAVSGTATNPTLNYDGVNVICATGTVDGVTGQDSDTIAGASVDFFAPCTIGGATANVECGDGASTVDLIAQNDGGVGGTGTVVLNADFSCVVTVPNVCSVTVVGPQTTQDDNLTLNESADTTTANVGVNATRTGSTFCGAAASDLAGFSAVYATTPSNLTIDP
jgi:hypothetical protein